MPIRAIVRGIAAVLLASVPEPMAGRASALTLELPVDCPETGCLIQNFVDHDPTRGHMDYACGAIAYDGHDGTDFRVPTRADMERAVVRAAAPGRVRAVRDGVADLPLGAPGAPDVTGRECGNGVVIDHADGFSTQYCHLARGSVRVRPGEAVAVGAVLGTIGLSGKTEFPHVHFSVRRDGRILDPFRPEWTPGACSAGLERSLWSPSARALLAYRDAVLLSFGATGARPTPAAVEAGGLAAFEARSSDHLVAFAKVMALRAGDALELALHGPDGGRLATSRLAPLRTARAQQILIAGIRRPSDGFAPGDHSVRLIATRAGKPLWERSFSVPVRDVMRR